MRSGERHPWFFIFISLFLFTAIIMGFLILTNKTEPGKAVKSDVSTRIISLGPALTEEIYLLGADASLIADTVYCTRPEAAKYKEKIGSVVEINVEKIRSLDPDVVLATPLADPKQLEKLAGWGIRIFMFPKIHSYNELCDQFLTLGKFTGKEAQAAGIVTTAKTNLGRIESAIENIPPKRVFMQIGAHPLFTVTKDIFVADFIGLSGGVNVAESAASGLVSREQVIAANPDVIIITTMGIAGESEKRVWEQFHSMNAVKNGMIFVIDDSLVGSPTPVSALATIKALIRLIHPEVKTDAF
jgi:iron complex transport system substrate-binding protein